MLDEHIDVVAGLRILGLAGLTSVGPGTASSSTGRLASAASRGI